MQGTMAVLVCVSGIVWYSCSSPKLKIPKQNYGAHAVGALSDIFEGQAYVRRNTFVDQDGDNIGEYADIEMLMRHEGIMRLSWGRFGNTYRLGGENGYMLKIILPEETNKREQNWCAVAWPAMAESVTYQRVLFTNEGSRGIIYESTRLAGEPTLKELYEGEPFEGKIRIDLWEPNTISPPDHPTVTGAR